MSSLYKICKVESKPPKREREKSVIDVCNMLIKEKARLQGEEDGGGYGRGGKSLAVEGATSHATPI